MNKQKELGEKCGVVGVWTQGNYAAHFARQSLAALQHRGQESAGISLFTTKGRLVTHKGMGLIPHVITDAGLKKLGEGHLAIGHNRYGTSGKMSLDTAQPIQLKKGKLQLSIGHNGNIPRLGELKKQILDAKQFKSDTGMIASLLLQERSNYKTWEETFAAILPKFQGAYCLVILTNDGSLYGIRDPYGIRPFCLGKLPEGWVMASESVALDTVGAEFVRDIKPGEIVKIDNSGKIESTFFGEPKAPKHCLFEYVYFARPDSFMNGLRIRAGREESGRRLARRLKEKNIHVDAVIPTFDSGYPAAKGAAYELGVPIIDAITTSHYVGRTFIHPGQDNRIAAVHGKHNIVPDEIIGKSVVIIDDSAVRLTTSKMLFRALHNAGAKAVYLGIASPPVVDQCDLGIDMRSRKELPAAVYHDQPLEVIEKKMAEHIGAEVIYLPIEETAAAMNTTKEQLYWSPFGGPHPIRDKQQVFAKRRRITNGKLKITVFASGVSKGKNLENIIQHIQSGRIHAEINDVFSNSADSPSIALAKKHDIPTTIIPYTDKLTDKLSRKKYEEQLVEHIKEMMPDLILLSGWNLILSDFFIKQMQQLEIPIINHHPALLTNDESDTVATSRGKFPVIRGNHKFAASFSSNVPVSGITVHQILPGQLFDVGPVIMKAEVRRRKDDTLETWEARNREQEYLLLPTALKRILHVMSYTIDISKGGFPW